jgi:hypothetical protein
MTIDSQSRRIPPLHDAQLRKHAQECHGSGEATVTHQAKPNTHNVRPEGLEPPTDRVETGCSIH